MVSPDLQQWYLDFRVGIVSIKYWYFFNGVSAPNSNASFIPMLILSCEMPLLLLQAFFEYFSENPPTGMGKRGGKEARY